MPDWVKAVDHAVLVRQGRALFRRSGKQIALFATEQGVFACDNRCPHEGYPLSEGSLGRDCLLTCNWHNWKFDLRSGDNLYGGDRVRVYPTALRDGAVWLDLAEPPFEQRRDEILSNLREAYFDHDYQRLARELGRLKLIGADPLEALSAAIDWSWQRLEFGWSHAYAGAADWLQLYDEFEGDDEARLICLLETIGHIADDTLRENDYPYPEGVVDYDEDAFVAAIDREDQPAAIAQLRGALDRGIHFAELERGFSRAALAHYADFGHSLIYVNKAGRLIGRLGESVERPLLLALVRSLVFAWREELIPEFRGYAAALERWGKATDGREPRAEDYRGLAVDRALEYTVAASASAPETLHRVLLRANAEHLLRYDLGYQSRVDGPVSDNVGWLSFTHGITFANAVREQCSRFPELWPAGLLQMACFAGRNQPYTDAGLEAGSWRVGAPEDFFRRQRDALLDHGRDEYIVSVHLLKTLLAARAELAAGLDAPGADALLAGLNRFLHSPLKRKHVRRTARQALRFVSKDAAA